MPQRTRTYRMRWVDVFTDKPFRGPLGAFAVRYGVIPGAAEVSIVSEQGTKMRRPSFVYIELAYPADAELPSRVEVGGSVVPVMTAELSIRE